MTDTFSVTSGSLANIQWTPLSIRGQEAISELFSFSIRAGARSDELDLALRKDDCPAESALLGEAVRVRIGQPASSVTVSWRRSRPPVRDAIEAMR